MSELKPEEVIKNVYSNLIETSFKLGIEEVYFSP